MYARILTQQLRLGVNAACMLKMARWRWQGLNLTKRLSGHTKAQTQAIPAHGQVQAVHVLLVLKLQAAGVEAPPNGVEAAHLDLSMGCIILFYLSLQQ